MIYHLALPDDWTPGKDYRISTRGRSLGDVGFIHCSYAHQLIGVATTFYDDLSELVVVEIDPGLVGAPVKDESPDGSPPTPGDAVFPHLYGPLSPVAVTATQRWTRSPDGWVDPPIS
ncbi:MAG: hypothetical protein CSA55_02265 [Ilumatobacter coccineus]|uniref:DUF952 domain-containing protein n=1 Tax=Ilumatobacter coccineus TaxID=467094 RepID=A0A2G6KDU9_9ACTN|nr:MAG: hypothetical protein CSA55_02265 [Ilumatobacter coccineus]